jgi:hypothetical protein
MDGWIRRRSSPIYFPQFACSLAFATCLAASQPANAWSLRDFLPPQLQPEATAADDIVSAYAAEEGSPRARHHRRLRHARHHRDHSEPERSADDQRSTDVSAGGAESSAPAASSPPTLQLVLTTEDGGDPFEQLMTTYYWNYLDHVISPELVFEPSRRSAETAQPRDEAYGRRMTLLADTSSYQAVMHVVRPTGF